jgi:hypothetical protein
LVVLWGEWKKEELEDKTRGVMMAEVLDRNQRGRERRATWWDLELPGWKKRDEEGERERKREEMGVYKERGKVQGSRSTQLPGSIPNKPPSPGRQPEPARR